MEKHTPPTAPAEEQSHEETIEKYVTQSVDFFCKTRSTGDLETLRRELPGLAVEYFHKLREACAPVTKPEEDFDKWYSFMARYSAAEFLKLLEQTGAYAGELADAAHEDVENLFSEFVRVNMRQLIESAESVAKELYQKEEEAEKSHGPATSYEMS